MRVKGHIKYMMLAGIVMIFLPVGLTVLVSGTDAVAIQKQMDMEEYLPMILCSEIPWDYEDEMLKAQAVLARSSLYFYTENENLNLDELKKQFRQNLEKEAYREAYTRMEKAVRLTRGEVMMWQGKVCPGVFHRVSAGRTRDGMEVFQKTEASYMESVESSQDIQAEEYLKGHYFTQEALRQRLKEEYPDIQLTEDSIVEQISIEKRDSQEYILEMKVGNLTVGGEEFRQKMQLSSCNFTIQELDGKIRFLCKGLGHGLGLSQYGGNELAREGKTYRQIIFTYFPQVVLKKYV